MKKTVINHDRYENINSIITSSIVRKMQEKSAMLPLDSGGCMRTLYSQSIEISVLSRVMAQRSFEKECFETMTEKEKKDIYELISCTGIVRGIGQPPFGHLGDAAIREWFVRNTDQVFKDRITGKSLLTNEMKKDLLSFSGVRRSARVIIKYSGLYEIPKEIINILVNSVCFRFEKCCMLSDRDLVLQTGCDSAVKPYLSYILEAAAYIVTVTSAIEDATENKYVICRQLLHLLRKEEEFDDDITDEEYQSYCRIVKYLDDCYIESRKNPFSSDDIEAVHKWIVYLRDEMCRYAADCFSEYFEDIKNGRFEGDLINNSWCRTIKRVFTKSQRQLFAASGDFLLSVNNSTRILYLLTDKLIKAVVEVHENDSLFSSQMRLYNLIPEVFRRNYNEISKDKNESEKLYFRIIMVLDYICSLSDRKAIELYRKLYG